MSDLDRTTESAFNGFSTPRRSPRKSRNQSSASDVSTSEIEVKVKKHKHWKSKLIFWYFAVYNLKFLTFSERRLETPDRSDSELSIPSSGSPSTLPSPVPKDKRGRFVSPETNPVMTLRKLKENAKKALAERRNVPEIQIKPPVELYPLTPVQHAKIRARNLKPEWVKKPRMFQRNPEENSAKIQEFIKLLNQTDVQADVSTYVEISFFNYFSRIYL